MRCLRRLQPAAEKQLPDARIGEDVFRAVRDAHAAELEHDAVIGILQRPLGVLLDHQHGDAARAHVLEQGEQLLHQDRRQTDRGLVDQHQLGFEHQPAGDLQHLLLAAGERRGLLAGLAAQHRETVHRGFHARREVEALRRRDAAELEIVQHGQLGKDVAPLRHVADAVGDQLARACGW